MLMNNNSYVFYVGQFNNAGYHFSNTVTFK